MTQEGALNRLLNISGKIPLDNIHDFLEDFLKSDPYELSERYRSRLSLIQGQYTDLKSRKSLLRTDDYSLEVNRLRNQTVDYIQALKKDVIAESRAEAITDPLGREIARLEKESNKPTPVEPPKKKENKFWVWVGRAALIATIVAGIVAVRPYIPGWNKNNPQANTTLPATTDSTAGKKEPERRNAQIDDSGRQKKKKTSDSPNKVEQDKADEEKALHELVIFTDPALVEISEGDEWLGETSVGSKQAVVELSSGSHVLVFKREGYRTFRKRITMPREALLSIELIKE